MLDREQVLGPLLMVPALAILAIFLAYPFVLGIYLSMSDKRIGQPSEFVGLQNFIDNWRSGIFRLTFKNTFTYTAIATLFKLGLGLGLALLMNQAFKGKNIVRAGLLLPWIVPTVLSALAWLWIFDATYSVLNWSLKRMTGWALIGGLLTEVLGMSPTRGFNWLGNGALAMASVITVNIWRGVPFFAISLLAGLQTISQELYEAAAIDGASALQRFRHVTLPLLRPVLLIVLLFSIIWTFADFQVVYVLTRGGPANSTHLLATLAYQVGLQSAQLGEGASISLFMFPVLAVVTAIILAYIRRD
ncbi:MAG: sugar ABC transporter permease [Chloroflexota bacterium]|nr:sugar ABC transporter permease [Chloroflexota bacterium]